MNLTSPSQVKAWCIANGFHPNRTLGQNYLIDLNAREAMVESVSDGCRVLEIGPGLGVLTEAMLARGAEVTAIEKDPALAERLSGALGSPAGLKVVAGDALDALARPAEFGLSFGDFDCLVSSLPYQAGTRILLELVQMRLPPSMTVLVQTEVAERLCAKEGGRTRGLAGVWTQLDYDARIVRLDRHDRNAGLSPEVRKTFRLLTKRAFEHRRKQLGSVFRDLIQSTARAEELSNAEWVELAKGLTENEDT